MSDKIKVAIYTLGCKVNQYESEAIKKKLLDENFSVLSENDFCDAYIINTCTVTAESDRKARQFIRRAINKNPRAYILVTGCFSQVSPNEVADIKGVDYICGNSEKLSVVSYLQTLIEKGKKNESAEIRVGDIDSAPFEKMSIDTFARTRAYIKIEDGCESKCTYCIIPSARGKIRSKAPEDVIEEAKALAASGCREIVLTGIETAAYSQKSGGCGLAELIERIDALDGIERIRMGSLDPSVMKNDFIEKIAPLPSLAPHFHLSVQSGSNHVLALMKRKYNIEKVKENIFNTRSKIKNVQFSTDIIVGFPGETEDNFNETLEFIKEIGFVGVHVFSYSKRKGTPAATMSGQIDEQIKHLRSSVLISAQKEIKKAILQKEIAENPIHPVLFETFDGEFAYGHTANFIEVKVKADKNLHSDIQNVRLVSVCKDICIGTLLK